MPSIKKPKYVDDTIVEEEDTEMYIKGSIASQEEKENKDEDDDESEYEALIEISVNGKTYVADESKVGNIYEALEDGEIDSEEQAEIENEEEIN